MLLAYVAQGEAMASKERRMLRQSVLGVLFVSASVSIPSCAFQISHHHGHSICTRRSTQQDSIACPASRSSHDSSTYIDRQKALSFGLGGLTAAFAGALLLPRAAQSAVPSIEEYYGAPGAKKKTDTFLNRSPQPKQPQTAEQGPVGPMAPQELVSQVSDTLRQMDQLITQERWDDLLLLFKSRPLQQALSPFLGYTSASKLSSALPPSTPTDAKAIEGRREVLSVVLRQLKDFAFSNRVIFFNELDKKQVAKLAASTGASIDLSEPRELLADAKSLLAELLP